MEKSPVTDKLFGLDVLRAMAIILVFLFHYAVQFPHPTWANSAGKFGWTGVDLFFVLSGYLIASQLFLAIANDKKIELKTFFIKRFFRIIPAYLLVVVIYFLLPFCREREGLAPLWKYLTFTQNLGLDLRYHGTFSHAWSLCIEEQFYLFLPIILSILVYFKAIKKGWLLLLLLFISGFLIRCYCWYTFVSPFIEQDDFWVNWYKYIYYPTYARLDGLLLGVSIAALYQFKPAIKIRLNKYGSLLLLASLCIFAATYFICSDEHSMVSSVIGFPLVDVGFACMLMGVISPNCFVYQLRSRVVGKVATLSYGIYLTHKIIIHLTQEKLFAIGFDRQSNWVFVICVFTCFIGALVLNWLIEKPFLKIRDKILQVT